MAIQWLWSEKCGEAIIEQQIGAEKKTSVKTLYEGNALLIFLNEWEEDGVGKYSLYTFFADENHAKICLGLDKRKEYSGNILNDMDRLVKIRINKKKCRRWKKVVSLFAAAFDDLIIELFTEENKDD